MPRAGPGRRLGCPSCPGGNFPAPGATRAMALLATEHLKCTISSCSSGRLSTEELAANTTDSSTATDTHPGRPKHCSLASDIKEVAACRIATSNSFAPDIHLYCYSLFPRGVADASSGCCSPSDPHSEACAGWVHTYLLLWCRCSLCAGACRCWTPPGCLLSIAAIAVSSPLGCQSTESSAIPSSQVSLTITGTLRGCSTHNWFVGQRTG